MKLAFTNHRSNKSRCTNNFTCLVLFLLTFELVTASCGDNCMNCENGVCKKCSYGFGKTTKGCQRCKLSNCKHCDDDTESCVICAIYHYREEIKEKRGSFGCKKCGFGCMVCESEDKCLKCGQMFKFDTEKPDNCIANHKTLTILLMMIVLFLMVTISLSFYCTNMTPDEERELIEKLERKKRLQSDEGLDEVSNINEDEEESNMDLR